MAIYQFDNLLGCNTLLDWITVYHEMPKLFAPSIAATPYYRDAILYFALQNIAPFQVCTVKYGDEYLLLQGKMELQMLLDFVFGRTIPKKDQWAFSVPFPTEGNELSYQNGLSLCEKEAFLETKIPHNDFLVNDNGDLDLLRNLYC